MNLKDHEFVLMYDFSKVDIEKDVILNHGRHIMEETDTGLLDLG